MSILKKNFFFRNLSGNGNNAKLYVQKIKLKNFRGYEGNIEIDLSDKNNTPASFTVVYAPNGVGKTSLFDGVEYALKGEVTYLKDIQKFQNLRVRFIIIRNILKKKHIQDLYLAMALKFVEKLVV